MNYIIGIVWFNDEQVYRRALAIFTDWKICPPLLKTGKPLSEGNSKRLSVLVISLFAQTSIRKHLSIGAACMDFKPIPMRERHSPSMSCSNMRKPAKERSSNSSFPVYAFAMPGEQNDG